MGNSPAKRRLYAESVNDEDYFCTRPESTDTVSVKIKTPKGTEVSTLRMRIGDNINELKTILKFKIKGVEVAQMSLVDEDGDELLDSCVIMEDKEYVFTRRDIDLIRVLQDPELIKVLDRQTEEICIAAVEQDGMLLRYVNNQTFKICLAAVRQNPRAIMYIRSNMKEIYRYHIRRIKKYGV